ncbi:hypothetical protein SCG7109_AC_00100 [Chlamydiales bacterium SCGC AG-110-M15]|nr:hypothetical protein SCG7109_AC_00100 [Chlamydiales bacterium SCGC AG-110-M15]
MIDRSDSSNLYIFRPTRLLDDGERKEHEEQQALPPPLSKGKFVHVTVPRGVDPDDQSMQNIMEQAIHQASNLAERELLPQGWCDLRLRVKRRRNGDYQARFSVFNRTKKKYTNAQSLDLQPPAVAAPDEAEQAPSWNGQRLTKKPEVRLADIKKAGSLSLSGSIKASWKSLSSPLSKAVFFLGLLTPLSWAYVYACYRNDKISKKKANQEFFQEKKVSGAYHSLELLNEQVKRNRGVAEPVSLFMGELIQRKDEIVEALDQKDQVHRLEALSELSEQYCEDIKGLNVGQSYTIPLGYHTKGPFQLVFCTFKREDENTVVMRMYNDDPEIEGFYKKPFISFKLDPKWDFIGFSKASHKAIPNIQTVIENAKKVNQALSLAQTENNYRISEKAISDLDALIADFNTKRSEHDELADDASLNLIEYELAALRNKAQRVNRELCDAAFKEYSEAYNQIQQSFRNITKQNTNSNQIRWNLDELNRYFHQFTSFVNQSQQLASASRDDELLLRAKKLKSAHEGLERILERLQNEEVIKDSDYHYLRTRTYDATLEFTNGGYHMSLVKEQRRLDQDVWNKPSDPLGLDSLLAIGKTYRELSELALAEAQRSSNAEWQKRVEEHFKTYKVLLDMGKEDPSEIKADLENDPEGQKIYKDTILACKRSLIALDLNQRYISATRTRLHNNAANADGGEAPVLPEAAQADGPALENAFSHLFLNEALQHMAPEYMPAPSSKAKEELSSSAKAWGAIHVRARSLFEKLPDPASAAKSSDHVATDYVCHYIDELFNGDDIDSLESLRMWMQASTEQCRRFFRIRRHLSDHDRAVGLGACLESISSLRERCRRYVGSNSDIQDGFVFPNELARMERVLEQMKVAPVLKPELNKPEFSAQVELDPKQSSKAHNTQSAMTSTSAAFCAFTDAEKKHWLENIEALNTKVQEIEAYQGNAGDLIELKQNCMQSIRSALQLCDNLRTRGLAEVDLETRRRIFEELEYRTNQIILGLPSPVNSYDANTHPLFKLWFDEIWFEDLEIEGFEGDTLDSWGLLLDSLEENLFQARMQKAKLNSRQLDATSPDQFLSAWKLKCIRTNLNLQIKSEMQELIDEQLEVLKDSREKLCKSITKYSLETCFKDEIYEKSKGIRNELIKDFPNVDSNLMPALLNRLVKYRIQKTIRSQHFKGHTDDQLRDLLFIEPERLKEECKPYLPNNPAPQLFNSILARYEELARAENGLDSLISASIEEQSLAQYIFNNSKDPKETEDEIAVLRRKCRAMILEGITMNDLYTKEHFISWKQNRTDGDPKLQGSNSIIRHLNHRPKQLTAYFISQLAAMFNKLHAEEVDDATYLGSQLSYPKEHLSGLIEAFSSKKYLNAYLLAPDMTSSKLVFEKGLAYYRQSCTASSHHAASIASIRKQLKLRASNSALTFPEKMKELNKCHQAWDMEDQSTSNADFIDSMLRPKTGLAATFDIKGKFRSLFRKNAISDLSEAELPHRSFANDLLSDMRLHMLMRPDSFLQNLSSAKLDEVTLELEASASSEKPACRLDLEDNAGPNASRTVTQSKLYEVFNDITPDKPLNHEVSLESREENEDYAYLACSSKMNDDPLSRNSEELIDELCKWEESAQDDESKILYASLITTIGAKGEIQIGSVDSCLRLMNHDFTQMENEKFQNLIRMALFRPNTVYAECLLHPQQMRYKIKEIKKLIQRCDHMPNRNPVARAFLLHLITHFIQENERAQKTWALGLHKVLTESSSIGFSQISHLNQNNLDEIKQTLKDDSHHLRTLRNSCIADLERLYGDVDSGRDFRQKDALAHLYFLEGYRQLWSEPKLLNTPFEKKYLAQILKSYQFLTSPAMDIGSPRLQDDLLKWISDEFIPYFESLPQQERIEALDLMDSYLISKELRASTQPWTCDPKDPLIFYKISLNNRKKAAVTLDLRSGKLKCNNRSMNPLGDLEKRKVKPSRILRRHPEFKFLFADKDLLLERERSEDEKFWIFSVNINRQKIEIRQPINTLYQDKLEIYLIKDSTRYLFSIPKVEKEANDCVSRLFRKNGVWTDCATNKPYIITHCLETEGQQVYFEVTGSLIGKSKQLKHRNSKKRLVASEEFYGDHRMLQMINGTRQFALCRSSYGKTRFDEVLIDSSKLSLKKDQIGRWLVYKGSNLLGKAILPARSQSKARAYAMKRRRLQSKLGNHFEHYALPVDCTKDDTAPIGTDSVEKYLIFPNEVSINARAHNLDFKLDNSDGMKGPFVIEQLKNGTLKGSRQAFLYLAYVALMEADCSNQNAYKTQHYRRALRYLDKAENCQMEMSEADKNMFLEIEKQIVTRNKTLAEGALSATDYAVKLRIDLMLERMHRLVVEENQLDEDPDTYLKRLQMRHRQFKRYQLLASKNDQGQHNVPDDLRLRAKELNQLEGISREALASHSGEELSKPEDCSLSNFTTPTFSFREYISNAKAIMTYIQDLAESLENPKKSLPQDLDREHLIVLEQIVKILGGLVMHAIPPTPENMEGKDIRRDRPLTFKRLTKNFLVYYQQIIREEVNPKDLVHFISEDNIGKTEEEEVGIHIILHIFITIATYNAEARKPGADVAGLRPLLLLDSAFTHENVDNPPESRYDPHYTPSVLENDEVAADRLLDDLLKHCLNPKTHEQFRNDHEKFTNNKTLKILTSKSFRQVFFTFISVREPRRFKAIVSNLNRLRKNPHHIEQSENAINRTYDLEVNGRPQKMDGDTVVEKEIPARDVDKELLTLVPLLLAGVQPIVEQDVPLDRVNRKVWGAMLEDLEQSSADSVDGNPKFSRDQRRALTPIVKAFADAEENVEVLVREYEHQLSCIEGYEHDIHLISKLLDKYAPILKEIEGIIASFNNETSTPEPLPEGASIFNSAWNSVGNFFTGAVDVASKSYKIAQLTKRAIFAINDARHLINELSINELREDLQEHFSMLLRNPTKVVNGEIDFIPRKPGNYTRLCARFIPLVNAARLFIEDSDRFLPPGVTFEKITSIHDFSEGMELVEKLQKDEAINQAQFNQIKKLMDCFKRIEEGFQGDFKEKLGRAASTFADPDHQVHNNEEYSPIQEKLAEMQDLLRLFNIHKKPILDLANELGPTLEILRSDTNYTKMIQLLDQKLQEEHHISLATLNYRGRLEVENRQFEKQYEGNPKPATPEHALSSAVSAHKLDNFAQGHFGLDGNSDDDCMDHKHADERSVQFEEREILPISASASPAGMPSPLSIAPDEQVAPALNADRITLQRTLVPTPQQAPQALQDIFNQCYLPLENDPDQVEFERNKTALAEVIGNKTDLAKKVKKGIESLERDPRQQVKFNLKRRQLDAFTKKLKALEINAKHDRDTKLHAIYSELEPFKNHKKYKEILTQMQLRSKTDFERWLDQQYMSNSFATQYPVLAPLITEYKLAQIQHQQVVRARKSSKDLKKIKTKIEKSRGEDREKYKGQWKNLSKSIYHTLRMGAYHDRYTNDPLLGSIRNKLLVAESRSGYVYRPSQIMFILDAIKDPTIFGELRMGEGKTSMILPTLISIFSEMGYFCVGTIPQALIGVQGPETDEATRMFFEQSSYTFTFNRSTVSHKSKKKGDTDDIALERSFTTLLEMHNTLLKLKRDKKYILQAIGSKAALAAKINEFEIIKSDEKDRNRLLLLDGCIEQMRRIQRLFHADDTLFIIDEGDSELHPKLDVTFQLESQEIPENARELCFSIVDELMSADSDQKIEHEQFLREQETLCEIKKALLNNSSGGLSTEKVNQAVFILAKNRVRTILQKSADNDATYNATIDTKRECIENLVNTYAQAIVENGAFPLPEELPFTLDKEAIEALGICRIALHDVFPVILKSKADIHFGLDKNGYLVVPLVSRMSLKDIRYANAITQSMYLYMYYASKSPSEEAITNKFLKNNHSLLINKCPEFYSEWERHSAPKFVPAFEGDKRKSAAELLRGNEEWQVRSRLYLAKLYLSDEVTVSRSLIREGIQGSTLLCNVMTMSGTAADYLPSTQLGSKERKNKKGHFNLSAISARKVIPDVFLRLLKITPAEYKKKPLELPLATYPDSSEGQLNSFIATAKAKGNDGKYAFQFLINQAGLNDEISAEDIAKKLHAESKRPIVFVRRKGDESQKCIIQRGKVTSLKGDSGPQNALYYFDVPDTRGMNFKMQTFAKGRMFLSPRILSSDFLQAAYRARGLGETQGMELLIAESLNTSIQDRRIANAPAPAIISANLGELMTYMIDVFSDPEDRVFNLSTIEQEIQGTPKAYLQNALDEIAVYNGVDLQNHAVDVVHKMALDTANTILEIFKKHPDADFERLLNTYIEKFKKDVENDKYLNELSVRSIETRFAIQRCVGTIESQFAELKNAPVLVLQKTAVSDKQVIKGLMSELRRLFLDKTNSILIEKACPLALSNQRATCFQLLRKSFESITDLSAEFEAAYYIGHEEKTTVYLKQLLDQQNKLLKDLEFHINFSSPSLNQDYKQILLKGIERAREELSYFTEALAMEERTQRGTFAHLPAVTKTSSSSVGQLSQSQSMSQSQSLAQAQQDFYGRGLIERLLARKKVSEKYSSSHDNLAYGKHSVKATYYTDISVSPVLDRFIRAGKVIPTYAVVTYFNGQFKRAYYPQTDLRMASTDQNTAIFTVDQKGSKPGQANEGVRSTLRRSRGLKEIGNKQERKALHNLLLLDHFCLGHFDFSDRQVQWMTEHFKKSYTQWENQRSKDLNSLPEHLRILYQHVSAIPLPSWEQLVKYDPSMKAMIRNIKIALKEGK